VKLVEENFSTSGMQLVLHKEKPGPLSSDCCRC